MKAVTLLENRGILLKETSEKVINHKGGFLGSLIRVSLPLMKNVLTPVAKNVLLPLALTVATSATDAVFQKDCGLGMTALIISNDKNERCHENN